MHVHQVLNLQALPESLADPAPAPDIRRHVSSTIRPRKATPEMLKQSRLSLVRGPAAEPETLRLGSSWRTRDLGYAACILLLAAYLWWLGI